ncbi:MAG: oxidoreductase [Frankiales bacterium]|nr:oxidoreductase [Frankiales bacterium]
MDTLPSAMSRISSLVTDDGTVRVSLETVPMPEPRDGQVLIRVEASPLNPSDIAVLLSGAKVADGRQVGEELVVPLPEAARGLLTARIGQPTVVGNEGSGVVVATGAGAEALAGKTVGFLGGGAYAEYRVVPDFMCLPLPDGTDARDGASCFVNPLTALGMVETMKREGHTALIHTAAASNLGQMLVRICLQDGIGLVNVVRRTEQAELLKGLGAEHVVVSSAPTYVDDLAAAVAATGATIGFDAIGGGDTASELLMAMETALIASGAPATGYGTSVHKQVYVYGGLDTGPIVINRRFGFSWSVAGWLLTPFLGTLSMDDHARLRGRVVAGLKTTFASSYSDEISLKELLDPQIAQAYARQATGSKYLVRPQS